MTGWSRVLIDSRSAYSSLREHLLRFIENPDELGSALDPLDDDQHVSQTTSCYNDGVGEVKISNYCFAKSY